MTFRDDGPGSYLFGPSSLFFAGGATPLSGRRFTDTEKAEILRLYESGVMSSEISRRFQCGVSSVLDLVRRLGGDVRSPGGEHARALTDDQEMKLIEMYEQGVRVGQILKDFNITRSGFNSIRRRRGVPARPPTKGRANALWKNGTRKPQGGYIDERVLSDDPSSAWPAAAPKVVATCFNTAS